LAVGKGATLFCRGYALVEIVIALTVSAFLFGALVQTVISINGCVTRWDRKVRMRQALSAALLCISRDIRMAGSNPAGSAEFQGVELGEEAGGGSATVRLKMDKRGRGTGTRPDGDIEDPDEQIEYHWEAAEEILKRNGQPVAIKAVANTEGVPVFRLEKISDWALVSVALCLGREAETMSLSTAVHVRNPL